ncbi:acyl-CoA dehydrogenase family protein [bacterium]|nr:acyl-CoA dehydrogenase family protein [bacterium]MCI0603443.1 acyl-CoA dehydrogenase family protein [bacterium]
MVRDTIREFVNDKVLPVIEKHNREATFPMHLIGPIAELGILGATLKGYGCAGLNNVAYGLIMQELERGDSGLRSFASVQGSLVMYPIYSFGSEEQKQYWLPELAAGRKIGCFGLTEPDFGSNPGGMLTKAVREGNTWVLNGTKRWITNGSIADVAVVWARTDEGIRGFLVEKGAKGFTTMDQKGKFSLRASVTSELIMEDCRIPAENILPGSKGLASPLSCLNQARYGIAWGAIGAAMACYDEAVNYAKTRIQFDKPIASFQMVQEKLVYMLSEITKGQLLCLQLGRLKDQGKVTAQQVSLAKMNNVYHALQIARTARDILGASGITDEYQCGRHLCNLESVFTYEGTHNIHTLILGEWITGIPAYK